MARIRGIKPDFFRHFGLYKAELETGLPLRVGYSGLWTHADREGRFRWKPESIKLDALPYDPIDYSDVLVALEQRGFIRGYEIDGERYGYIPSWHEHQRPRRDEKPSKIPEPTSESIAGFSLCAIATSPSLNSDEITYAQRLRDSSSDASSSGSDPPKPPTRKATEPSPHEIQALRLLDLYADEVKARSADSSRSRAKRHVIRLLESRTPDVIEAAIRNYARHCQNAQRGPAYRYNAGNFFGRDQTWQDFVTRDDADDGKLALNGTKTHPAHDPGRFEGLRAFARGKADEAG